MSNKLQCVRHKQRIHVLPTETVVHRSDGSTCDTTSVSIGGYLYSVDEVLDPHRDFDLTRLLAEEGQI